LIVRGYAAAGVKVYITAREGETAEPLATELQRGGVEVHVLVANVSTEAGCRQLALDFADRESRLDILVNNAGTTWGAPLEEFDEVAWERVLSVNVKAPFHLTKFLLPQLTAASEMSPPARVINIGSIAAFIVSNFENYSYTASKAALHQLTRHLAKRLAPSITVNTIDPGSFMSKMTRSTIEEYGDAIIANIPMKRLGGYDDIAGTAIYLASSAASYVTGASILVDGGVVNLS
jgi:NAD(P)-dependent dehydrogenase (short-subunit alcohol dehydrogenase family)